MSLPTRKMGERLVAPDAQPNDFSLRPREAERLAMLR